MRFCPFCAQENPDDARECGHCGKRLPPPRAAPPPRTPTPPPIQVPKTAPRPAPRSRPLEPSPLPQPLPSDPITSPVAKAPEPITTPVAKSPPDAATLAPPLRAKSGTVLGIPAMQPPASKPELDPPTAPSKLPPSDSAKRTTKPIDVAKVAQAAHEANGSVGHAKTVAAPPTRPPARKPEPTPFDEQSTTVDERAQTRVDDPPGADTEDGAHPLPPLPVSAPLGGVVQTGAVTLPGASSGAPVPVAAEPTPVLPTLAVPPMPPQPKPGLLEAVKYLVPLANAVWARRKAQGTIRTMLLGDQRVLDQVLRELGKAAREAQLEAPAIADEMRRVRAEEDRRSKADAAIAKAGEDTHKEHERWSFEEQQRNAELTERESAIRAAEEELKQKGAERRAHEAERAKIDGQIRAAEKRAAQADARAAKAEVTPPEKGGGPNTAANARAEAAAARAEASSLIPERDEARAKVEALDGPIAALTKQVADGRATLGLKRKELTEAQAAHKRTIEGFAQEKRRAEAERDGAEREMSQRFVSAGTLLNLNRVESPRFAALYSRIDELKGGVNAREAAIVRLESELRSYDKAAVQKGLLAIGIAFGTFVLLMIVLIVLVARR